MDQKPRRKKYIGAAVFVVGVCFIGIGFGLIYTGEVTNTGNSSEVNWIVLTLDDDQAEDYSDAFDGTIYYDTYTNATGTTWIPQYDTDTNNDDVDDGVLLGTVMINVERNGENSYSISMTKTAGTMTGDYKVGVKAGSAATTFMDYSDGVVILNNANTDVIVTVSLYYVSSSVTSEPTSPMENVTFKFTAEAQV